MARFLFSLVGAWFLFCGGSALNCEYDTSVDEAQGLNFVSAAGQAVMDVQDDVSDPEQCRERCCNRSDCDLALVGYPMDGPRQCMLVKCWVSGHDVCELKPSIQFKVYRKTTSSSRKNQQDKGQRVVPLVHSFQPKESSTDNSKARTWAGGSV